jgi:uncharacterized protein YciI
MLFMIHCTDKPNHGNLRQETREEHLAYLREHEDRIVIAGPIPTEDGSAVTGSLLIMEFDGADEARAFAEADPYNRAGLFDSVTVKPFKKVFG